MNTVKNLMKKRKIVELVGDNVTKGKIHYVQFKISGDAYQEMKKMREFSGLTTFADLVKLSLSLFKKSMEYQKNDYTLYAIRMGKNEDDIAVEKIQLILPL